MTIIGDFETRSGVELKNVGTYEYARHPSTEVMSYGWTVGDDEPELWHPAFRDYTDIYAKRKTDRVREDIVASPEPYSLFKAVKAGHKHEAHNAFFERAIWYFIMVKRYGWPEIGQDMWVCTAALAASYALRAKLDHVTHDLGLSHHKDSAGHKIMMKHTKPRNLLKWERRVIAEDNSIKFEGWEWENKSTTAFKFEDQGLLVSDDFPRFLQLRAGLLDVFSYNLDDVRAERELGGALRPLPETERIVYNLDQKINWRGLHCDRELVNAAIKIGDECDLDSQEELSEISGGDVCKVTQRDAMKTWLNEQGVKVPEKQNPKGDWIETTEAAAMEEILEYPDLPEHVTRACQIWLAVNKTSTKKYRAILNRLGDDDRVRESMRMYAASTGRWGGKGIQPHNFPRKCPKDREGEPAGSAMERACQHVMSGDYELVCMLYGRDNVMQLLSSVLRGTITPAPGNELIASDYSAVEARGTFWVTGHEEGLEAFRLIDSGAMPGQDIYTWQASEIHGRTIYKSDDQERQDGKVVILGCLEGNSLTLTARGWVPLQDVGPFDEVWDGEEWVAHEGLIDQGLQETVELEGLWLTTNHEVLTADGWSTAGHLGQDESTPDFLGAIVLADCALPESNAVRVVGSLRLGLSATAGGKEVSIPRTFGAGDQPNVHFADAAKARSQRDRNTASETLCRMTGYAPYGVADTPLCYPGATTPKTETFGIMAREGSKFAKSGTTDECFSGMFKPSTGGIDLILTLTEQTTTEDMNPETLEWSPTEPILRTLETRSVRVFDLLNAGPRRRFTVLTNAGPLIVHNCGYQMGGPKLVTYAAGRGVELSEERAIELVAAYREKNWPVKQFWYKTNDAAIRAIRNKGTLIKQEHIAWGFRGRFLHCRLPSGRLLSYLDPKVVIVDTPWGKRPQIQFWGVDTYTRQWIRTSTYGGKLTENVVQALCRDIMAEAMVRAEQAGYHIVLTVHDEIVAEVPKGFGSVEEFNAILSERPSWADGFPIVAEGWRAVRYRK